MIRPLAVFAGVFLGVLAVLLAAVGQLGKIDRQTLVVVLALSLIAAVAVTIRSR